MLLNITMLRTIVIAQFNSINVSLIYKLTSSCRNIGAICQVFKRDKYSGLFLAHFDSTNCVVVWSEDGFLLLCFQVHSGYLFVSRKVNMIWILHIPIVYFIFNNKVVSVFQVIYWLILSYSNKINIKLC